MARPGITYEQVRSTANILWKQGLTPSIQRIRETLGTGSNSTIATHLKRWQQEHADKPATTLPPSIPEQLVDAVEAFWAVAFERAESNFDDYREQVAQTVVQVEHQRDHAITELALLRDETRALSHRLTREQSKNRELEKHLLVEQERVVAIELQHSATEERLKKSQQEVEKLREEVRLQTSRHSDTLQQLRVDVERRIAEAEQRLAFERERGEASEARLMNLLDQAKTEHNRDQTRFAQEHQSWQEQEATFRKEISIAENRIATAQFKTAMADETNQRLEASRNTEHDRYLKTARLVDDLRTRLKAANADRRRLEWLLAAQTKS